MRPFILRSLSRYAEKMGHEVAVVALDGAEAVERIYEVQPDTVLLDLNMPEKDGIAVIREACLDRMIPVIIITGHYSELLMNRADIPNDDKNIILEIRAGAGGDAAHEMIAARETLL